MSSFYKDIIKSSKLESFRRLEECPEEEKQTILEQYQNLQEFNENFFQQSKVHFYTKVMDNNFHRPGKNLTSVSNFDDLKNPPNVDQEKTKQLKKELFSIVDSSNDIYQQVQEKNTQDKKLKRFRGKLKFFDFSSNKQFGFIQMEGEQRDIFVHKQQLEESSIPLDFLQNNKHVILSFSIQKYHSKFNQEKERAFDFKIEQ